MESGSKELYIVLGVMGLLFVIACTAVVIFIRVWKKERGGKGR
jgi:type IV secretory pathway component VirB8